MNAKSITTEKTLTNFIGGRSIESSSTDTTPVYNRLRPSTTRRQKMSSPGFLEELETTSIRQFARGDVRRGMEVLDFACNVPPLLKGDSLPQVADQIVARGNGAVIGSRWK